MSPTTRSTAKHPADISASPRKRKALRDPSPEESADLAQHQTASRRSKRSKQTLPQAPLEPAPLRRQRKTKASTVMSSSGSPANDPEEASASQPATASSSSSKKRAGKNNKPSSENADPLNNKRSRPSTSKKSKKPATQDRSAERSADQDPDDLDPGTGSDRSGDQDDPTQDPDQDEAMEDDPFEHSFLGRAGGHAGISSTLRALSGMMSGMTSRLRQLLENLKQKDDPSVQLIALQELSEVLLVSNEDNLAGHFPPDQYVKELVPLMQPGVFGENPEVMLLACRCISNMMEALPASTATVVYGGAVPVLISKLLEIQYMDVAEQALIALEKISSEFPASIVREGGLTACLTYLDFFPSAVQRTAVTTAANCCRNIPNDSFSVVKDVMPILLNVLGGSEQRVVEQGCLCVSRIVDSFKYQDDKLEELISTELLRTILGLLLPGSTNMIGPNIHTQFLRVLSVTARASPSLTVELFKMNVVETLYQILTGVSPPSGLEDVAQKIDSVVIMQALIHRPRDQIFETLNVICELLPGLKGGLSILDDLVSGLGVGYPEDAAGSRSKAKPASKRLELLASCKDELRRFAVVLLPTLTDAYSSTVNLGVRQKVMTAQLKMLLYLDVDILEDALRPVPYSSFLASMLSQQDHPFLVTTALQAAELLLKRLEHVYRYQFYREGVMAEIQKLSIRPLAAEAPKPSSDPEITQSSTAPATNEAEDQESPSWGESYPNADRVTVEAGVEVDSEDDDEDDEGDGDGDVEEDEDGDEDGEGDGDGDEDEDAEDVDEAADDASHSSDSSDSPQPRPPTQAIPNLKDIVTRCAIRFLADHEKDDAGLEPKQKANSILEELRNLVSDISACYESGRPDDGAKLFSQLAKHFEGDALESITSYELLTSQVVDMLLDIFEYSNGETNEAARAAFVEVFMSSATQHKIKTASSDSPATSFSVLVHKLQDLLSRSEHFEVVTVHSNAFESNRSSAASMLAKQIRVKLTAGEDSGIPEPYRNIMVSIHAIATFKALDDYLRPRISLTERSRAARERHGHGLPGIPTGMPTTYAAAMAGFEPPASASRSQAQEPTSPASGSADQSSSRPSSSRKHSKSKASASRETGASEEASSSTAARKSSSRRSSRKSKSLATEPPPPPPPPALPTEEADDLENALECADETQLSDDEEDMDETEALETIVGELEEEVDDDAPDPSAVNMEIASTGKVTARQEDGTRVDTPTSTQGSSSRPTSAMERSSFARDIPRSLLSSLSGRSLSYAAALAAVPQDWHLEFSVNGQPISNGTTIYRAVHFNQSQPEEVSSRSIWSATHSIDFKRVEGPAPAESNTISPPPDAAAPLTSSGLPQSLDKNPTTASILRLLRILHEMNSNLDEILGENRIGVKINGEPLSQFVNTKLTAKLNRQLEEPLIVASNCLPSWSEDLARLYPFLFPFETRHLFLQSTSFGYSRSMTRWQNAQTNSDAQRGRHRDERPFLGRLQRQKVRISRHKLLESAVKVIELYGASPSILEVEYFEEVGTGLGPTLEFYSNVSKEFSRKKLKLWRENESNRGDEFVFGKQGLFPAPMSEQQLKTENGQRVLQLFKMLGKFVARSLLDSRIIDVSFNSAFFRSNTTGPTGAPSLAAVKSVDEDLYKSLQMLRQFAIAKKKIVEQTRLTPVQKAQKLSRIQVAGASVDDLSLDFTLPGYPSIELIPNGSNTAVTIENITLYVEKVIDFTLGQGVQKQIAAFRTGFSQVFPYSALAAFTPEELVMLFGRTEEDWSLETLMDSTKADHGYNLDSKSVRNLLHIMSELSLEQRREFLQFVTGSPKLPIGGFKSLTPMLTVVCKPSEPPYSSDDYLPSVMTCVNYLKLPDYSTLDIMKQKLNIAIREGQGAFHLS